MLKTEVVTIHGTFEVELSKKILLEDEMVYLMDEKEECLASFNKDFFVASYTVCKEEE